MRVTREYLFCDRRTLYLPYFGFLSFVPYRSRIIIRAEINPRCSDVNIDYLLLTSHV